MDGGILGFDAEGVDESCSDHSKWFVLQLKPGGLERARTNLWRQGVSSFMPMRHRTTRRAGRLMDVKRPLFPGYLFIELGRDAPAWRSINATYGVAKVVCLEPGQPFDVPGDVIAALKAASSKDGDYMGDPEPFLPGETVRVVAGPFASILARVEAVPERDRMFVLLDMMGREVRGAVRPGDLERA
ncbi:MAG: transcriptional activator RfaH [Verrucomicrobiota bacterium]